MGLYTTIQYRAKILGNCGRSAKASIAFVLYLSIRTLKTQSAFSRPTPWKSVGGDPLDRPTNRVVTLLGASICAAFLRTRDVRRMERAGLWNFENSSTRPIFSSIQPLSVALALHTRPPFLTGPSAVHESCSGTSSPGRRMGNGGRVPCSALRDCLCASSSAR